METLTNANNSPSNNDSNDAATFHQQSLRFYSTPIVERILSHSSHTQAIGLSFVDSAFRSASFRRMQDTLSSGHLSIDDDDAGPLSQLTDMLLTLFQQSQCRVIRITYRQLIEPNGVEERCRLLASLLERSRSTLERLWIGAERWRSVEGSPRVTTDSDHHHHHGGAVRLNGIYMLACSNIYPEPESTRAIIELFAALSRLLGGECGKMSALRQLVVAWPIEWGFVCRMKAPRLSDLLVAAPELRFLHVEQGSARFAGLRGVHCPSESHPLDLLGDPDPTSPITMPQLRRIGFGSSFSDPIIGNDDAQSRSIDSVRLILGVITRVRAPRLARIDSGSGWTQLEALVEHRRIDRSFPSILAKGCWLDARRSGGRPPARFLAVVLAGALPAYGDGSSTLVVKVERNDAVRWFDSSGIVRQKRYGVAHACQVLEDHARFGATEAKWRRLVVLLVAGRYMGGGSEQQSLESAFSLLDCSAITLVMQWFDEPILEALEDLDSGIRCRMDKAVFNWQLVDSLPEQNGEFGCCSFDKSSLDGAIDLLYHSLSRIHACLPRLRRIQVAVRVYNASVRAETIASLRVACAKLATALRRHIVKSGEWQFRRLHVHHRVLPSCGSNQQAEWRRETAYYESRLQRILDECRVGERGESHVVLVFQRQSHGAT